MPTALAIALGVALAANPAPVPRPGDHATAPWDWASLGDETAAFLSGYLAIDTTNPPGREAAGAAHIAQKLAEAGITAEIHEVAPGRANLVARVRAAAPTAPPLCLLSHIDVASTEPERWSEPPFSGRIDEAGRVWGRGALDMKGMGALEVVLMVQVARSGVPLRRDLVLLAVADEEGGNTGIAALAADWARIGCSHVVNEGGIGIADMLFPGQTVFPISVAEKGILWARLEATGAPGHGSTPRPGQSPAALLEAAKLLASRRPVPRWDPALVELLGAVGAHKGGLAGFVLQRPLLARTLVRPVMMGNPLTRAAMTDTVNLTGLGGALETNVVPATSWAHIDGRLLPGTAPEDLLAELQGLVRPAGATVVPVQMAPATVTDWRGDDLYAALAHRAVEGRPDAVAGPVLSVGYTDSIALRPLGVKAYGFVPFVVTAEELGSMHGDNEYVTVDNLRDGLRTLSRAVLDVSAVP
jgi:acetylornithine deacetylase/succinyl-diaminopimelate desuccinylase-like protein